MSNWEYDNGYGQSSKECFGNYVKQGFRAAKETTKGILNGIASFNQHLANGLEFVNAGAKLQQQRVEMARRERLVYEYNNPKMKMNGQEIRIKISNPKTYEEIMEERQRLKRVPLRIGGRQL